MENGKVLDEAIENEMKLANKIDLNMDIKKIRRTLSNRLSAQRSRIRKIEYVTDLEKQSKDLEATVTVLAAKVKQEKQHQAMLRIENDNHRQKLKYMAAMAECSNAEIEAQQAEVKRLVAMLGMGPHKVEDEELEQIMCMSHQSSPPQMFELGSGSGSGSKSNNE